MMKPRVLARCSLNAARASSATVRTVVVCMSQPLAVCTLAMLIQTTAAIAPNATRIGTKVMIIFLFKLM